ncbi:MAG: metallophosphoesterase [Clostridium butyricum]|nr:metallophosphoesterase [Clostridium butyricum]
MSIIFPKINKNIFWIVYILCALCIFIGNAAPRFKLTKIVKIISGYYMGTFVYLLMIFIVLDIIRIIFRNTKLFKEKILNNPKVLIISGAVIFGMVFALILYGNYNAKNIQIVNYDVTISRKQKVNKELNIVMVSDIHIGDIIAYKEIEEISEKINKLKPDIILISGDVFDGDYYAVEDIEKIESAFKKLNSKYGTYAALGNHDAGSSFEKMIGFFQKADIKLLQDEFIDIEDEFTVVGRKDFSPIGEQGNKRKDINSVLKNVDSDKPIIMLDHQPSNINEAADNNIDLLLCGHTHKGQLFPGNLITNSIFLNDYGYLKVKNTNIIVSSGVGTWGPRMRIGSKSEIVNIKLKY